MTKVVRTTPIDRSKRTAVKGDIVGTVNIIHGKRKRRLSNNSFNEDYIISSPRTPKKNKQKTRKTPQKKVKSESEDEDDDDDSDEEEEEVIIPLSGNRNKYKIVDEDDEEEEEEEIEEELKEEEEEFDQSLFSQELKKSERKKKPESSSVKTEPLIAVCDCSEFGPISVDPYKYFSKKIVEQIKRLGGEFPQVYDSRSPIVYGDNRIFSSDSLRVFTRIKWGEKQFKSSLVAEIIGMRFELFVIEEIKNFEFIHAYVDRIVLIGDAADCVLGVDAWYPLSVNDSLGDFWVYIIIDEKRKEAPHKLRLSTLLESLTIDETDYGEIVDVEFTQK